MHLIAPNDQLRTLELAVDTGNPCAIIIDAEMMQTMRWRESSSAQSNFGSLDGGWLRVAIPELEFDVKLLGHANDSVVDVARRSDAKFVGLAGLPLLRMLEYGGNGGFFRIRPLAEE